MASLLAALVSWWWISRHSKEERHAPTNILWEHKFACKRYSFSFYSFIYYLSTIAMHFSGHMWAFPGRLAPSNSGPLCWLLPCLQNLTSASEQVAWGEDKAGATNRVEHPHWAKDPFFWYRGGGGVVWWRWDMDPYYAPRGSVLPQNHIPVGISSYLKVKSAKWFENYLSPFLLSLKKNSITASYVATWHLKAPNQATIFSVLARPHHHSC